MTSRKGSAEKSVPHTRIEDDVMIAEHYEVGSKIGQGSFGKVYEATQINSGVKWAIKSINKEKAGSSALKLVEREVAILKRVHHPNIIILNEVIESPKRMYLVMELCKGGELADFLKEKKYFTEEETKLIMGKLASAIAYLHKNGIVHRDLKLENILMGENSDNPLDKLHVKVNDFGLSVVKGGVTPDNMMQDICGTPIYMAPEILDNKTYSQQCDVWALGIIMYTLLCGHPPFRAKEESVLYDLIREAKVKFEEDVWNNISKEGKNCILGMLKLDPAHRLSASEVLYHPWITGEMRDSTKPSNVLEMMKLWKDELRNDENLDEDNTLNRHIDDQTRDELSVDLKDSPTCSGSQGHASKSSLRDEKSRVKSPVKDADAKKKMTSDPKKNLAIKPLMPSGSAVDSVQHLSARPQIQAPRSDVRLSPATTAAYSLGPIQKKSNTRTLSSSNIKSGNFSANQTTSPKTSTTSLKKK